MTCGASCRASRADDDHFGSGKLCSYLLWERTVRVPPENQRFGQRDRRRHRHVGVHDQLHAAAPNPQRCRRGKQRGPGA